MKHDTVWVIEQGEYSDYRVVGVFSSAANAQRVADAINVTQFTSPAEVAEWPLDPGVAALNAGHQRFIVWMRRDGTVERSDASEMTGYAVSGDVTIWRRSIAPAYRGKGIEDCLQADVWAVDVTHAIKIANEHRLRLIATGEWDQANPVQKPVPKVGTETR